MFHSAVLEAIFKKCIRQHYVVKTGMSNHVNFLLIQQIFDGWQNELILPNPVFSNKLNQKRWPILKWLTLQTTHSSSFLFFFQIMRFLKNVEPALLKVFSCFFLKNHLRCHFVPIENQKIDEFNWIKK